MYLQMAVVTPWTDTRLRDLFERYRASYWPTSRRLKAYRIEAASLPNGWYGLCVFERHTLQVDLSKHPSDREIRATVLHEMAHAVIGLPGGHGAPFWMQLEYLLSHRAPITVRFPELGERGSLLSIIPARFRRCRRLFRPVYERDQRAQRRLRLRLVRVTPKMIETECEDGALEGTMWRVIWPLQSSTYGFVDLDGRVLPWARRYQVAARRGYVRGRRTFLEAERNRARFVATGQSLSARANLSP